MNPSSPQDGSVASGAYRPDIDGLRAIAVSAVVLDHLAPHLLPGGYVGVDVFFVISGYLITQILERENRGGTFTLVGFYERRMRRIFPALFAVLLFTVLGGYFLFLPSDYASTLGAALGTVFFASNIVFWREMMAGYFAATDAMLNPLLHTWSLGVEEQFYVLFPIFLALCMRYAKKHTNRVLIGCALVSLLLAQLLVHSKGVAVFFLSPFRAWELLAGGLLALYRPAPMGGRRMDIIGVLGLAAVLVPCFIYDNKTTFPGLTAVVPVAGAVTLIYAGTSRTSIVNRGLAARPITYIGLISYSLYLWHWPVFVFAKYSNGMTPFGPATGLAWLALSFVLAALSYHFIEQPFRRRQVVRTPVVAAFSGATASIVATVCCVGLFLHGFASRFPSDVVRLDEARAPAIPFVSCDSRPKDKWCGIGAQNRAPSMLFWGDSHALALAPAMNKALTNEGIRAVFVTNAACPAVLGVRNSANHRCAADNRDVQNYLVSHPEVRWVVLAGYWSTYFKPDGPLSMTSDAGNLQGVDAASAALLASIEWLRSAGKRVLIIGPVPVYDRSVPLMAALERATHRTWLSSTAEAQWKKHAPFYAAIADFQSKSWVSVASPIDWMCESQCETLNGDTPLYRDAHHLSLAGALAIEPRLESALQAFVHAPDSASTDISITRVADPSTVPLRNELR